MVLISKKTRKKVYRYLL